jgi:hypothetical protein
MDPESVKRVLAEREKLKRWQESIDANSSHENPPNYHPPSFTESTWASRDCIDVFYDGEGDKTIRPMDPDSINRVLAEREKLKRWQDSKDGKNEGQSGPPTS